MGVAPCFGEEAQAGTSRAGKEGEVGDSLLS